MTLLMMPLSRATSQRSASSFCTPRTIACMEHSQNVERFSASSPKRLSNVGQCTCSCGFVEGGRWTLYKICRTPSPYQTREHSVIFPWIPSADPQDQADAKLYKPNVIPCWRAGVLPQQSCRALRRSSPLSPKSGKLHVPFFRKYRLCSTTTTAHLRNISLRSKVVSEGGGWERESSGRKRLSHRLRRRFPLAPCHDFYEWCCRLVSCCLWPLWLEFPRLRVVRDAFSRYPWKAGTRARHLPPGISTNDITHSATAGTGVHMCIPLWPSAQSSVSAVETAPVHRIPGNNPTARFRKIVESTTWRTT
jgi:hypothetical protein